MPYTLNTLLKICRCSHFSAMRPARSYTYHASLTEQTWAEHGNMALNSSIYLAESGSCYATTGLGTNPR